MKVALYCRVSKKDEQTPENQRLILEEYAKKSGWEYMVFVESSTSRETRPLKQILMQSLREKKYDAVCVLKLDRWARSLQELVMDVTELYERGIPFISIRDGIDLSTPTGKLYFHIMASFAEFERDLIRERTMDGLARARAKGITLGRPRKAVKKQGRIYVLQENS
jgi:DNA invertase Pin-like site-specific DNA recombinase